MTKLIGTTHIMVTIDALGIIATLYHSRICNITTSVPMTVNDLINIYESYYGEGSIHEY